MEIRSSDHPPLKLLRPAAWSIVAGTAIAFVTLWGRAQEFGQAAEVITHSTPATPAADEIPGQEFVEVPHADVPAASESLHCSLDMIDDHPAALAMVLDHRLTTTFIGWIADDRMGVPRNIALLLIGNRTYAAAGTTGLARSDVAAAKHNPAFAFSGYSVMGKPAVVPQGEYHLAMIGQFEAVRLLCPLGHTIAIK